MIPSLQFKNIHALYLLYSIYVLCILEQKNFKLHQKIHLNGLISHITFRVGFKWQLAVASTKSSIYQMGDNLQFNVVTSFDFGNQIQWMYVPVDTYREDVILLSKSNAGMSALIWNGNNNYQIIDKFDDFVCKNGNEQAQEIFNAYLLN